jgi:hypothetical protein
MKAVKTEPVVLEVETSVGCRHRGAVKEQRAVVRYDRCKASEVALAVSLLPISGAKHTVEVDKRRR